MVQAVYLLQGDLQQLVPEDIKGIDRQHAQDLREADLQQLERSGVDEAKQEKQSMN